MAIRTGSVVVVTLLLSAMACSAADSGGKGLGSDWGDTARMPDFFTGMWMTFSPMVEADAKLDVPYTPTAQKYVESYKFKRDIPYAQEGCTSPGLPIAMRSGPVKFAYTPGLISIYLQGVGHTRFIRMNQPMGKTAPKYYGNSVGHFEGDTLVVETSDFLPEISFQYGIGKGLPSDGTSGPGTGLGIGGPGGPGAPGGAGPRAGGPGGPGGRAGGPPPLDIAGSLTKAIWGPHGEKMHMVERMRLVNKDSMEIALTLYDDTVWTKPYVTATRTFTRIVKGKSEIGPFSGEAEEWVCTVSVTSFDPDTNTYQDKDPEEMVKFLDKLGR